MQGKWHQDAVEFAVVVHLQKIEAIVELSRRIACLALFAGLQIARKKRARIYGSVCRSRIELIAGCQPTGKDLQPPPGEEERRAERALCTHHADTP